MRLLGLRLVLILLFVAGVGALAWAALAAGWAPSRGTTVATPVAPRGAQSGYAADSLAGVVVNRDLFRIGRRPAPVHYNAVVASSPDTQSMQRPKPTLALTGIVWGAHPEAVIVGLPAADGARVVRVGDVVGGITIRYIDRAQVVATGFDTTWMLAIREPWQ